MEHIGRPRRYPPQRADMAIWRTNSESDPRLQKTQQSTSLTQLGLQEVKKLKFALFPLQTTHQNMSTPVSVVGV